MTHKRAENPVWLVHLLVACNFRLFLIDFISCSVGISFSFLILNRPFVESIVGANISSLASNS